MYGPPNTRRCSFGGHLGILIASLVIMILMPSIVGTYGIYVIYLNDRNILPYHSLWTPALFLASYYISKPWYRDSAESWIKSGGGDDKTITFGAALAAFGVALNKCFSYNIHFITYGILSGLGTSIVICRLQAFLADKYPSHSFIVNVLMEFSIAFGHLVIPQLLNNIAYHYGISQTYMLHGAIVLHVVPATMFIKYEIEHVPQTSVLHYSNVPSQEEDVVVDTDSLSESPTEEMRSWKSPSDSSLASDEKIEVAADDDIEVEEPESPRRKNLFGVEILPDIPEEDEKSISSSSFSSSDTDIDTEVKSENVPINGEVTKNGCGSMEKCSPIPMMSYQNPTCSGYYTPYQQPSLRSRTQSCRDSITSIVWVPFMTSVKRMQFYPALLLKIAMAMNILVFTSLVPVYAHMSILYGPDRYSSTFFTSTASFAWISTLVMTPWLVDMKLGRFKYIAIGGLCLIAAAFFKTVVNPSNQVMLAVNTIIFGIGFGATSYVYGTSIKHELGADHFPEVRGTLDTLTGVLVIVFMIVVKMVPVKSQIRMFFAIVLTLNLTSIILWLAMPIIKTLKKKLDYNEDDAGSQPV